MPRASDILILLTYIMIAGVAAIGFERNSRAEAKLIFRKTGSKNWEEKLLTNEDGSPLAWPDGDVTLEIARIDHKKGRFELYLNGASVGTVDLGLKRTRGPLYVGFKWTGAAGNNFKTTVDEVEIELYDE